MSVRHICHLKWNNCRFVTFPRKTKPTTMKCSQQVISDPNANIKFVTLPYLFALETRIGLRVHFETHTSINGYRIKQMLKCTPLFELTTCTYQISRFSKCLNAVIQTICIIKIKMLSFSKS